MQQGGKAGDVHNKKGFAYNPKEIHYLFVTHAHIDHIGLIPKLCHAGFEGPIYSTVETKRIAELLLLDAVKIGREKDEPLYTLDDVSKALSLWQTVPYHTPQEFEGFKVEYFNAGHVLGSGMVKFITEKGKTMLFSGDIGNSPSPLLPDVEKVSGLDYLLMESVYGDRNHESKELRDAKFKRVVEESIARGGALLIPAFSLERTQVILSKLDNLFESGQVKMVPVFLDSPLAIKITAIYESVKELYNQARQDELSGGDDLFKFKSLHEVAKANDSHAISQIAGPKIIIAGSGMSTAGRILSHEEIYLPDQNSTILLAGYQAVGTLGRLIEEGEKHIVINDKKVIVRARVEKIDGFSAHADSDALVRFVSESEKSLKKVFVAMGEPKSAIFLSQRLRDELGVEAVVAEEGKSYEIDL
jgi:metallo-beta-lactamase family protein